MISRFFFFFGLIGLLSCEAKESDISKDLIYDDKPLLVSEIGEGLEIIEVKTKYPISGTPTILKSKDYFYLFEQGLIFSLHQLHIDGRHRKTMDFGFDERLNAEAISQITIDGERIGVVAHGDKMTWFDEDFNELESEVLPIRAKYHFRHDGQTIAHTNQIADYDWEIVVYDQKVKSNHLLIDKSRYPFFNQVFSPFSEWNDKVVFSKAFNDTIYVWSDQGFEPLLHVDFGVSTVTNERFGQIQNAMDMLAFFGERKYSYLQGEIFGLDANRILFQVNEKGTQRLGLMNFDLDELTIYPGLVDNSISGMNLGSPQFAKDGVLYFGVSGEELLSNFDKLGRSFQHRLSANYSESYFIYQLKLK